MRSDDTNKVGQCPFHGRAVQDNDNSTQYESKETWPPGPRTRFTGWSLLQSMSQDFLGALAQWKKEFGDLIYLHIWPEHEVVINDPAIARELLVSHHENLVRWEHGVEVFSQLHGKSVLTTEGAHWYEKRQALQPNFTPKAVEKFLPTIESVVKRHLDTWPKQNKSWPIERYITAITMDVIARLIFSSDLGDELDTISEASQVLNEVANKELYWPVITPSWLPWKWRKRKAFSIMNGLIEKHVQIRLKALQKSDLLQKADGDLASDKPNDLMGHLLQLHQDNPKAWPLQAVRNECMTAFLAGHETVAVTLTWWLWCMASQPHAQEQARQEVQFFLQKKSSEKSGLSDLSYLNQTVKESMRLYPAAPVLMTRRSTQSFKLGQWVIPKKTLFIIPVYLLHHDERWFPEPEKFIPERFNPTAEKYPRGAYMPFGTGPRVCLGQHMAMTEVMVIASLILQRYCLSMPDHTEPPVPVLQVSLRPRDELKLNLQAS